MEEEKKTIDLFKEYLQESKKNFEKDNIIYSQGNFMEAYIRTMSWIIENSKESTLQGLYISIKDTSDYLLKSLVKNSVLPKTRTSFSLEAVSEVIFLLLNKYTSKKTGEDFYTIKHHLVNITHDLFELSSLSKEKIFHFFQWSLKNNMTILVHGYSMSIVYSLIKSRKQGKTFKVYVTKGQIDDSGKVIQDELKKHDIECHLIFDLAIAFYMKDIDCVLVGANAVCENGGIINKIGTFTLAICAKNFKKPFYVMADSLKFLKMYPIDQSDIAKSMSKYNIEEEMISCDFTPPEFITLLFTDIGIFTPSAVSDELIQMYYN